MNFAVGNLALFTILHASKYYEHLVNIIKVVSISFKTIDRFCHAWPSSQQLLKLREKKVRSITVNKVCLCSGLVFPFYIRIVYIFFILHTNIFSV